MTYTYPYPRPALTVDVTVFCGDGDRMKVLLIRRGRDPHAGLWALPGGFVDADEDLHEAAARELVEETGLLARLGPQLGAYGAPGRDPRGHTVSVVFLAWLRGGEVPVEGQDDALEARWHDARRSPRLAFDHGQVLKDAVAEFERRCRTGIEECLALLPRTFGVAEVRDLVQAGGAPRSASALRPELRRCPGVREVSQRSGRLTFRIR